MKRLALMVWLLTTRLAPGEALEKLFADGAAVWQQTPAGFMDAQPAAGFRWVSTAKDSARTAQPGLTFLDERVWEALARFEAGALREVTLSLYNRGDAGDLSEAEFAEFMKRVDGRLTAWAGAKGVTLRTQERTSIATLRRKAWVTGAHRVDLVWSFSEKSRSQGVPEARPEFARLQVTKFDAQNDPRKLMFATATPPAKVLSVFDLKKRVTRQPGGDVLVAGVPMVDQGVKGYCAAAVAERVLRYYGRNVDQHEIAQLANTTAQAGTNPQEMIAALRRISREVKMEVTVLRDFDGRDFEKMLDDYNREARKVKRQQFELIYRQGNFIFVNDPVAVYTQLDPGVLKAARVRRDADMLTFKQTIVKFINAGAPLAWSVMLGKIAEQPAAPGIGGHMRLITGFNEKNGEILYSDTWGAGHELKRLSLAEAWTITLGLYCMHPREVRF